KVVYRLPKSVSVAFKIRRDGRSIEIEHLGKHGIFSQKVENDVIHAHISDLPKIAQRCHVFRKPCFSGTLTANQAAKSPSANVAFADQSYKLIERLGLSWSRFVISRHRHTPPAIDESVELGPCFRAGDIHNVPWLR